MIASQNKTSRKQRRFCFALILGLLLAGSAYGQTCLTANDMDEATRAALVNSAKRYFDMAARGDSASLRQNSIASVASDFAGIENAVKDNQANFAGAQATSRPPFLLKAEGTAPLAHAEFLCGVLQQQGNDWKLGGFYGKPLQVAGHDGNWYVTRAREYKAKGQTHNAWLYFLEARELLAPVPFMSTLATDKLYDEAQGAKPSDLPPSDLSAGGKTFKVTSLFPLAVGNDLDLVVKYQSPDVSNTTQTFQDNMTVTGQHGCDEGAHCEISGTPRGFWRNRGPGCGNVWPRLRIADGHERY